MRKTLRSADHRDCCPPRVSWLRCWALGCTTAALTTINGAPDYAHRFAHLELGVSNSAHWLTTADRFCILEGIN